MTRHAASLRAGLGALALAALVGAGAVTGAAWRESAARAEAEALAAERLATTLIRTGSAPAEEADAAWREFLELDENRGTRALGEGWRRRAAALQARGDSAGALDAWAQAYAVAPDADGRHAALVGLARTFRARWAWEPLDRALERLAAAGPLDAELRTLRAETDLALARPSLDRDALPPGVRPLVDALAPAQRTELPHGRAVPLDVDGDGRRELVVAGADLRTAVAIRADTTFAPVLELDVPPQRFDWLLPVDADEPLLIGNPADGGSALYGIERTGPATARMVERFRWSDPVVLGAAWADPDGDGRRSLYVGHGPYVRALRRLDRVGDSWVVSAASPETDAARSDVGPLAAADLDGDGQEELVAVVGPWRAFDVRVLGGEAGGALRIEGRRTLGYVHSLGIARTPDGPRVVVIHQRQHASLDVFDAEDPWGGPPGLVWLAVRDGALVEEHRDVPPETAPGIGPSTYGAFYADFDGDGLTDAAVNASIDRTTGVWVISGADHASFVLHGVTGLGVADLDGDEDDELLVAEDGWMMALGTGDGARTPRPPTLPAIEADPELGDPYARAAWARADELVAMGLVAQAASHLEEAAALLGPADAQRTLVRAGGLRLQRRSGSAAVVLYRRAAALAQGTLAEREALDGLARASAQLHDADAAVAALDQLIARLPPGPERDAAVARREAAAPLAGAVVSEVSPVDPRWQVRRPESVRRDADGLGVAAWNGGGDVLVLPLRWDGGRLGLTVTFDVETLTWGSGLAFELRPVGGEAVVSAGVDGGGGGGLIGRMAYCRGRRDQTVASAHRHEPPEPERETLEITVDLDPFAREAMCTADSDGVRITEGPAVAPAVEAGADWELVVVDRSMAGGLYPLEVRVRGVRLVGATVRDAPPAASAPTDAARVLAALAAGRQDEAAATFAAMLGRDHPAVPWLLYRAPDALEPVVARERLGGRFWELFLRAWGTFVARPETPRAMRVLDRPVLDALTGATLAERRLLLARARAAAAAGRIDCARADFERLLARAGDEDRAEGLVTQAETTWATIEHGEGRAEDARRHADAAIAASPTPHLTEERLGRVLKGTRR